MFHKHHKRQQSPLQRPQQSMIATPPTMAKLTAKLTTTPTMTPTMATGTTTPTPTPTFTANGKTTIALSPPPTIVTVSTTLTTTQTLNSSRTRRGRGGRGRRSSRSCTPHAPTGVGGCRSLSAVDLDGQEYHRRGAVPDLWVLLGRMIEKDKGNAAGQK